MKNAYLLTIHYINNYGSVLQTFASQQYLASFGYDCSVINYTRENATKEGVYREFYKIYRNCNDLRALPIFSYLLAKRAEIRFIKKSILFDSFRKKFLKLTKTVNKDELYTFFCNPALYIVGSDQTWNYDYNGGFLPEYYLSFVKDGVKISLSSSIGNEHFNKLEQNEVKKYLKDFQFITVREKSAVNALNEIGIMNAQQVLDPTLLLSRNNWIKAMNLVDETEDYILVYQLNHNMMLSDFASNLSKKTDLKIVRIHTFDFKDNIKSKKNITPEKFCQLFLSAKYIVTDSFHGTAFSINFNRKFFVFQPPKYSTRIKSILELCNMKDRLLNTTNVDDNIINNEIDYTRINKILEKERFKVNDLMNSLTGD